MLLEIMNGKTDGEFPNLTMQEWQEATQVGIDYIVRVRRHKVINIIINGVWSSVLNKTAIKVETTEEEHIDGDVDDPSDIDEDEEDAEALAGELEGRSVSSRRDGSARRPVSPRSPPLSPNLLQSPWPASVQIQTLRLSHEP